MDDFVFHARTTSTTKLMIYFLSLVPLSRRSDIKLDSKRSQMQGAEARSPIRLHVSSSVSKRNDWLKSSQGRSNNSPFDLPSLTVFLLLAYIAHLSVTTGSRPCINFWWRVDSEWPQPQAFLTCPWPPLPFISWILSRFQFVQGIQRTAIADNAKERNRKSQWVLL